MLFFLLRRSVYKIYFWFLWFCPENTHMYVIMGIFTFFKILTSFISSYAKFLYSNPTYNEIFILLKNIVTSHQQKRWVCSVFYQQSSTGGCVKKAGMQKITKGKEQLQRFFTSASLQRTTHCLIYSIVQVNKMFYIMTTQFLDFLFVFPHPLKT